MNARNGKSPICAGRCYIIAEVGVNHNGDLDIARKLIDMAADAGADAVKFQNFRAGDFLSDRSLEWSYDTPEGRVTEPQYDMFKRYELTGERLETVVAHCRERGIDFASTPTSEEGVKECVKYGAAFLKNGSDYLSHLPLIRAMARTGLQTVLSTGMATVADIEDAVEAYYAEGGRNLVLLHCISLYPAPHETLHLRRIPLLAKTFECLAGFSDHSEGISASLAAVALGAVAIERHVTLDKSMMGPDHSLSADPDEWRSLVTAVREVETALGDEKLGSREDEIEARHMHRLSCVASSDLPAGTVIEAKHIAFRRPGTGMPPKLADRLVGKTLMQEIKSGKILDEDMLQ